MDHQISSHELIRSMPMSIKDHPEPIQSRHRKVYTNEFKESAMRLADGKGAR